jgi:hypothetical protein
MSRYIGDPDPTRSLALSPFSGYFTRLCAIDLKSRNDHTTHMVRAPFKLLGGALCGRPCSFTPIHHLTSPVGQSFASCLGGQQFTSRECTHAFNEIGFSCLQYIAKTNSKIVVYHYLANFRKFRLIFAFCSNRNFNFNSSFSC